MSEPKAESQALLRNVVWVTLGVLVTNICLFVGNWAVVRGYGSDEHGRFLWILAASRLLVLLGDLGIASKAGVRRIARRRVTDPGSLGRVISHMVTVQVVFAAVLAAGLILLAEPIASLRSNATPSTTEMIVPALRLAGACVLLQVGIRVCIMISIGFERMLNVLLTNPVCEVLKVAWIFVCWARGLDPVWIFVGWVGANLAGLTIGILLVAPLGRAHGFVVRPRLEGPSKVARLVADSFPYYVPFVSMLGLPFLMVLLIGYRLSGPAGADAQSSFFQVCWSLALISRLVSTTAATAIFPRVAHLDASRADSGKIGPLLTQASRLTGLASSGLFAMFLAAGALLLGGIYGPGYAQAKSILLVLAMATAIENYTQQLDQVLMGTRSARVVMWTELLKFLLAAGAAWWLIPAHGAQGAAVAVAGAVVVSALVKVVATRVRIRTIGLAQFAAMLLVCAALTAAQIPLGPWVVLPLWLALVLLLKLLLPSEIGRWIGVFRGTLFPRRERTRNRTPRETGHGE